MKLIIDIPEDLYRFILQHGIKDTHEIDEVIANGTPYNPTGDAISREALKKAIQECEEEPDYQHDGETWQNGLYMAETLVDNAQTVEYTFEEAFQRTVCEQRLYCPERPKGEWIKSKDGYTRCSLCGSRGSAIKARFCHHCGADMQKGGAE